MKRTVILFSISFISLWLILTGCTNKDEGLNQSMIIANDVQNDTEPELKVISKETFSLDEVIESFTYAFIEKEDGSTLIRYINSAGNLEDKMVVKIDRNKATSEYVESINDEYRNINKTFYLENLGDNRVLLTDWYSDNKFEVDEKLVSNDKSRYVVSEDYLIELVNFSARDNIYNDSIAWTNLINNSTGTLKMPEDLEVILSCSVVGDRLFLAAVSTSELAALYEEWNVSEFSGYGFADTLLVIDLTTNEIIEKTKIGRFTNFYPIDNERVIFAVYKDKEKVVEMYNLNNKTRKELMKYSISTGAGLINLTGLDIFPSRDKIYYCEEDGVKISLKVAEINGMDIENVITVYEVDKKNLESFSISNVSISSEGRGMKIFNVKLSEKVNVIDKIIKIKLSK